MASRLLGVRRGAVGRTLATVVASYAASNLGERVAERRCGCRFMRVPLSWLRDYVDVDLTPEQLAERLTLLGMEVKGLERWGAEWQNVVVGELLTVARHPRADRLSLTTVDIGDGGAPLEIVCGATNIAPGQRVPVALPGAVLPGGRRIERAEKMGVVSNGMLCSGDELNLTTDADGILILPAGTPLGRHLSDLYGDTVLDVDVKPNRGDVLSLIGLAREVSASTGAPVRWPVIEVVEGGGPIAERLAVEVREPVLCSRFVARWVSDVQIAPSPDQVQMRLRAAGMRPISNVVDASNYVMLELGKPTHTFDAAAIHGGRIVVRLATPGETLETLDHEQRTLDADTLVIADPEGAIGIAGIMGGASSEIGDTTTDVVVESAVFDPVSIRRTGQRYALRSEASLRFEKGQEVRLARIGADRVAQLLTEWAGGTVAAGRIDTAPDEPDRARIAFRPGRLNRLLGASISSTEQRAVLARVGIETIAAPAGTMITISGGDPPQAIAAPADEPVLIAFMPTWRTDLSIEADVSEEVARVRGYEIVPGTIPDTSMPSFRPSPLELRDALRDLLAGAGLNEVVTHALVSPRETEVLRWPLDDDGGRVPGEDPATGEQIVVRNPLSAQHSVLRQQLIGSVLGILGGNLRQGRDDVRIFEIGKGYGRLDGRPHEWWRLAIALTGHAESPAWNRVERAADLDDLKGVVELLCTRLGMARPEYTAADDVPPLHPGRSARVRVAADQGRGTSADQPLAAAGFIGEVHPDLLAALEIRAERVVIAQLAIRGLTSGQPPRVKVALVPRFPAVERDLAVVIEPGVTAGAVEAAIRETAGDLLREVRLFDVYPMADRQRSLAYRLEFQAADRTLTDGEIEAVMSAVRGGLERLGGRPRT